MRDDLDIPMPVGGPSYRVSRHPHAMDRTTRRLALVAGGIGATLLVLVGAYALTGHRSRAGVPLVSAAAGPVRVKPDKPGGMDVLGGEEDPGGAANAREAMAAPAEAPDPKGLQAQEKAAPAIATAAAPAASRQAALTATDPAPAATAPAPVAANPEVKPVVPHPAPPSRAAPAATDAAPAGAMQVQLAALTSEAAAMAEWTRLSRRMPDLFGTRHPAVTRTERDGKTWFRLRVGGFADTAQAATFCQHVREKGGGCSIASF